MSHEELVHNQEFIQDGMNQAVEGILKAINAGALTTGYHSSDYVSMELWKEQPLSVSISKGGIVSISIQTNDDKAFMTVLRKALQKDADNARATIHDLNEKINELDKQIAAKS